MAVTETDSGLIKKKIVYSEEFGHMIESIGSLEERHGKLPEFFELGSRKHYGST